MVFKIGIDDVSDHGCQAPGPPRAADVKAIILGAGQGRRLLPLTSDRPKALLRIGERSLLAWQIASLVECGVDEVVFVSGFGAGAVEATLEDLAPDFPTCCLRSLFNPFFRVSDNLASCWLARGEMTGDFLLINGDTLFEPALCATLLESPPAPVTVALDRKAVYDADDMKVRLAGTRLVDVGKGLPLDQVHGEAIGMSLFRDGGGRAFVGVLERLMRDDAALKMWYLSATARLGGEIDIDTCLIGGRDWCEVDFPEDLARAEAMVARWQGPALAEPRSVAAL